MVPRGVSSGVFLALLIPSVLFLALSIRNLTLPFHWVGLLFSLAGTATFAAAIVARRWGLTGVILALISVISPIAISIILMVFNYEFSFLYGVLLMMPALVYLAGAIAGLAHSLKRYRRAA